MSVTADYVEAVLRRARQPMEPTDFAPNWDDKPYRTKVYPGVTRIPLPLPRDRAAGSLGDALRRARTAEGGDEPFDLESLSAMLLDSYGLIARRVGLTGNEDSFLLPWYEHATWARGTASGGGLYSVEIYWVTGPNGPLLPGVYHYSPSHHAMERLLSGDVADQVRAAVPSAGAGDQFLVLGVKFWKNSFKYNTFCYHVVTMDVGTLLGTWALWAGATGRRVDPALWFDETACNRLLGLDGVGESVFGVLPLRWRGTPTGTGAAGVGPATVERTEREKSRTVVRFPRIEAVQAACLAGADTVPTAEALAGALPHPPTGQPAVPLPDADPAALAVDVDTVLRDRKSSFGGFVSDPGLGLGDLATVLDVAATTGRVPSEVTGPGSPGLTRLAVFATHVDGLAEGAYDYDPTERVLRPVRQEPVGRVLQWNYFLRNYNLEQAAATIAVIGRPGAVVEALGDRGYRLSNADVGAMAQALYVGASAARVGCGAVLGFDNVALAEALRIDDTDEWPLLLVMIGNERPSEPTFDYRLD